MTVKKLEKILAKAMRKNRKNEVSIQKAMNKIQKDFVRYSEKQEIKKASDAELDLDELKKINACVQKLDSLINGFFKE